MKIYLTTILSLIINLIFAQQNIYIDGIVWNKKRDTPVQDVAIYSKNSGLGTLSSAQGLFRVKQSDIVNDTLYFSHIGYADAKVQTKLLKNNDTLYMEEKDILLDQIIVKPLNAKNILEQCIANFSNNHINADYNGVFKQTSNFSNNVNKLLICDVVLRDNDKNKSIYKNEIRQFKKEIQPSIPGHTEYDMSFNQLFYWLQLKERLHGLLKNIDKLGEIKIIQDIYSNYNVYVISIIQPLPNNKKNEISFTVEQKTFAIIELDIIAGRGEGIDTWRETLKTKERKIARIPTSSTGKIVFRPFEDKWIPSTIYIDLNTKYLIQHTHKEDISLTNTNTIQIWINNINSKFSPVEQSRLDIRKDVFNQIDKKIEATMFNIPLSKEEKDFAVN